MKKNVQPFFRIFQQLYIIYKIPVIVIKIRLDQ